MKKQWLMLGLVLGLGLFNLTPGLAQNKRVRYIQDLYFYVKNKIAKEQYYLNEYQLNSTGKKLPQKGEYKRLERFFYSFSGKSQPTIRTITIKTEEGSKKQYEEFLYDLDGQLIFYYESQNNPEKKYRELSIYFHKGEVIHIIQNKTPVKPEEASVSETVLKAAWKKGERYHKKFDEQIKAYTRE
ncbi:hypothetical protein BKI52_04830 [marine bacterium AO1-C]|nr:hypothetical protein BKI52_04830 [marine bacterium AO1-C]